MGCPAIDNAEACAGYHELCARPHHLIELGDYHQNHIWMANRTGMLRDRGVFPNPSKSRSLWIRSITETLPLKPCQAASACMTWQAEKRLEPSLSNGPSYLYAGFSYRIKRSIMRVAFSQSMRLHKCFHKSWLEQAPSGSDEAQRSCNQEHNYLRVQEPFMCDLWIAMTFAPIFP